MPMSRNLPIMPKEIRPAVQTRNNRGASASIAPYPTLANDPSSAVSQQQRNAAIWSSADDDVLLQARASGLNWQPIAHRYFPNKTPNACRKRHERLMERRHVEEWDSRKLEMLAEEYLACRKQMWEILAERVGERWAVVEAKVRSVIQFYFRMLVLIVNSAWRKASSLSRSLLEPPIARPPPSVNIVPGARVWTVVQTEVFPTIIAIPESASVPMLRWT